MAIASDGPDRPRGGGVGDPLGRHGHGRRLRARRRAAHAHRRARRELRRDRPDDRLEQHRRAGPRARQAAAPGTDQARDLVVLHLEPRGRRGGERRRDRGDARAAGDVRRGDPRRRRRHRRLLHARRRGDAARRGQGGARHRRRAARARAADPRRRRARLRGARRRARQPLVPAHGAQLQPADGDRRDGHDRRGGRDRPDRASSSPESIETPHLYVDYLVRARSEPPTSRLASPRARRTSFGPARSSTSASASRT